MHKPQSLFTGLALTACLMCGCQSTNKIESSNLGGQVHFRGGYSHLDGSRGGEVFTDALGLDGTNSDDDGFHVGAGLDVPLFKDPFQNTVLGEIDMNYFQFSREEVLNLSDVVTDGLSLTPPPIEKRDVTVNEMTITVSPKYRFDSLGKFRPWVVPAGLAFLVTSPPSETTSYLDVGMTFGGGAEYQIHDSLSLGADVRYTLGFGASEADNDVLSTGGYLGINF